MTDGSIVVEGKTYKLGRPIHLGGGEGNSPYDNNCAPRAKFFYV